LDSKLCQSKIQGFETRESLSLRFPGNTLETPLDYPSRQGSLLCHDFHEQEINTSIALNV